MRTALPAPAFLRDARERRREVKPEDCNLCSPRPPQIPYHFVAGRHPDEITVLEARRDPNAFVEYALRSEATAPHLGEAWQRLLDKGLDRDRLLLAPVGRGMSRQLETWRREWIEQALARGERVAMLVLDPAAGIQGEPLERVQLDDLGPPGTWNQRTLADRMLERIHGASPGGFGSTGSEERAWIDAHAVDDIAPRPTLDQRIADVQDGIWRDTIQRVADERGWNTGPNKNTGGSV